MFDTETKDLVTVHTDGNEQLSGDRITKMMAGLEMDTMAAWGWPW